MKKIEGWRTFIVVLVSIGVLVLGLFFVSPDHRKDVFVFFSGGLVGLASTYVAKAIGVRAVGGEGLKGGVANLMGPSKPGDTP